MLYFVTALCLVTLGLLLVVAWRLRQSLRKIKRTLGIPQ